MKTNRTHKANGDIYFCGVRIYNGYRQEPVRWVEILLYIIGTPIIFFLFVLVLGADALI